MPAGNHMLAHPQRPPSTATPYHFRRRPVQSTHRPAKLPVLGPAAPSAQGESGASVHRVCAAKCSASRSASATIVNVGLAALEAGNKDEPAM